MNLVILQGTLWKDVELNTTPSWQDVAKVSIATNKSYKDKEGQKQQQTTWHNLVAWRHTAKFMAQYFQKGSKALVTWEISNRSYEKDWVTKYTSEVIVNQIEFAWPKPDWQSNPNKVQSDEEFKKSVQAENWVQKQVKIQEDISVDDIPF